MDIKVNGQRNKRMLKKDGTFKIRMFIIRYEIQKLSILLSLSLSFYIYLRKLILPFKKVDIKLTHLSFMMEIKKI